MALYIDFDNQRLIWNSMMKIPIFQHYKSQNQSDKERWFYGIMQKMANTKQSKILTVQDLQQLNRETVAHMISVIKEDMAMQPYNHSMQQQPYNLFSADTSPVMGPNMSAGPSMTENKTVTRGYISEQKQEELNKQFSDRQKDYQLMSKNEPIQEVHFHLEEDKPIDNMEELIQNHMRARSELALLVPPPPAILPETNAATTSPSKKVHWSIEPGQIEPVKTDVLPNLGQDLLSNGPDFQVFREFMIETREFMKTMREEMEQLKNITRVVPNDLP